KSKSQTTFFENDSPSPDSSENPYMPCLGI
ncbi:MAG: hypothetical protein ACI9WT_001929, partial [Flavobacterium sp.]